MSTEVELKLTADTRDAERGVGRFSRTYSDLVKEITRPLGRVNAFRQLEASLEQTGQKSKTARDRVRELGNELARTDNPSRQLTASYRDAVKELKSLESSEKRQTAQLSAMRQELKGAGVDTRNLAREQDRLQKELNQKLGQSDRQGALESARRNLGLAAYGEAQVQVSALQRDLQLLQSTGKLSAAELAIVGGTINTAMSNARSQVQQNVAANATWTESLQNVRGELLAGGIAFGAIALAGKRSFDRFSEFKQGMAEVGTITELSEMQMSALAVSVRRASREMGEAASGGASALYDIISAGVDAGDSVRVLGLAGKAAVAGLTDTKTAAGIGLAALNAYGDGTDKLEERFDQLFLTVKGGVTTFPELASSLGDALPIAAAAEIEFGDLAASVAQLTKQGLSTPKAITGITGAISALTAPTDTAKKKMQELGIEWTDLAGTLQQIADQNLGPAAMRELIPEKEARTAVLALTSNMNGLVESIEGMRDAGGTMAGAYGEMKDTPEQEIKRFQSAVTDLQISFGQAVAAGLPLVNLITDMFNVFNELPEGVRTTIASLVLLGVGGKALQVIIKGLAGPFSAFVASLSAVPAATTAANAGMGRTALAAKAMSLSVGKVTTVGLALWAADTALEFGKLYLEMRRLNQGIDEQKAALQDTIDETSGYRNALILAGEETANLTEAERKSYTERLQNAKKYYTALAEQISRADMERDGPTGAVSQDAINAAAQARMYSEALSNFQTVTEKREQVQREHVQTVQTIQQQELASVKTELAKQLDAYDDAAKELEQKLKKIEQLRIDSRKRFEDLANSFNAAPGADAATYANANAAKVAARQALALGDTEEALALAEKAAKFLEGMRDAGENTYGFAGMAKDLQQIADAALQLDAESAQAEFEAQKAKVDELVKTAKALETINVGFASDEESEAQTKARIIALAAEWAKYMQVPITYEQPDKVDLDRVNTTLTPPADGFSGGGWTGPGSKYKVAGVVHADEYVQPKYRMQEPGALQFMEKFRRYGMAALRNGYAEGGLVSSRMLPSIPPMPAGMTSSAGNSFGTPVALYLDGVSYEMRGRADEVGNLARAVRIKKLRS